MIKSLFQLLLLFLLSSIACKADPQWWTYSQTSIWSGSPQTTGNKAPIVAGQLKHVANQAKKYLDGTVASAGGAGSRIDDLINDFGSVDNTAIVNIGQLRHVAGVFYERLWDLGFSAKDYLIANQGLHPDFFFGVSGPFYPWNELSTDYGIATIGQLKLCFSFDLGSYGSVTDTDNDGLPDWWESNYFGNLLKNATGDDDGDGATNGAEYQGNFVPTDSDTDGDGVSDGIEASDGGDENYQRVTIKVTTPSDRDVVVYHNTVEARTFSPPGEVDVFFKESVDDHTIFIATDPKPGDPPGGIPYSVEIVPWAGGTQVAEAFTRWIFNSSVSASIPSGNFNLSHNASWEFNDVSVEIVEEAGKGSGVFVPLNNHFPVYVDATTMSFNSSYAYTGGSYEVVFADIPSGSTTDSVDIIFEDVSGSASHTLTETSNNSGVFQNGTIVLTVSPVPSFTDDEADEITAVISGVLGFTSASMNFDETLRNSLRFVQERPDVSVVLPTGLRAGSIDTAEVMVDVDGGVQSDTFTETSVSSRLFTNTSTRYCNIANPTTLSSSIADTLTVELGLGDRDISLRVTETGSTSKTFLNYSADASGATVVSPETDHSGVFFVKIDKNDVPSQYWNNLPIVLTSGSNTTNVTANLVSGADYLITGPLIALYPGASASFASLTPISLASGLLLQVSMPAIATQGKKARGVLPPFVGEAGAVPMDDHLKIISDPFSWKEAGKPKKGLGYPKATLNGHVRDTDIADIIPKHDIFYLFAHGIVDNTKSTLATTISNPIAAGFRAVQIFTDSFGLDSRDYTLTPNDISTVLDTGHEYKLVFLNGCASFDNENDKMVEFTNAFQTDYYCGWLYPVTGVSASLAAKRFLWALDRTDSVIAAAKGLWAAHPTARMNYGGGGDLKPARVPLRVNENVSVPVHLDLKR